jgi:membrane protein implicated in regulation of membrane protease activity
MAANDEKVIQPILLYMGLFLAVIVFAAAILVLLMSLPPIGVDAAGRKVTVISAHEKMIVSVLINTAQLLMIAASAGAIIVLLVNMRRRLDRLTDRVQSLARALETPGPAATPSPDPAGEQP